ncbi:hypothetical protein BH09PSE5_BH09PSE5_34040 [soil metagenome]
MEDIIAGIGARLVRWRLDPKTRGLHELGSLDLPAAIQYAWPHPSGRWLYVASSDGGGRSGPTGKRHHITTCAMRRDGSVVQVGPALAVPSRPIHLTVDPDGAHVLAAFNQPAALRSYRIGKDASVTAEVRQPAAIDAGNYPHQVRVTPDGQHVLSTALGQNPAAGRVEDPGSIRLFAYADGKLKSEQLVAPGGGYGFGPRHLDIHPNGRWVYVSVERQNRLDIFELAAGRLSAVPKFSVPLLSRPQVGAGVGSMKQISGAIHVHPNGRFLYCVNRASDVTDFNGVPVFAGGENTLAVFAIDAESGRIELLQHADTGGFHCRAFTIDPTESLLCAAHITGMNLRSGDRVEATPPRLSVFDIADDGRLTLDRSHDIATGGASMFWLGMPHLEQSEPSTPLQP